MRLLLFLLSALATTPPAVRVDAEMAVERARYAFVIGATKPFDELYPRSIFEKRVEHELLEEAVLQRVFGLSPTAATLAEEFDRIEATTRAPEQWAAIKQALGNDRRVIEDIFCRPLLVARALRARFAFDPAIHAAPHQQARNARGRFLAGRHVPDVSVLVLRRRSMAPATTDAMLQEAKSQAALPRVISEHVEDGSSAAPLDLDPEVAAVLQQQLRHPGDVTTILEERDRFTVYRLITSTDDAWTVQALVFPKVDFDAWFAQQQPRLK